jgi:hypothetical protein
MVPRPDIEALPYDAPLEELVDRAAFGRYTRYPVYEDDLDHVPRRRTRQGPLRAAKEDGENFDLTRRVGTAWSSREQANRGYFAGVPEAQAPDGHSHRRVGERGGFDHDRRLSSRRSWEIQDEFDEPEAAIEPIGDDWPTP